MDYIVRINKKYYYYINAIDKEEARAEAVLLHNDVVGCENIDPNEVEVEEDLLGQY